MSERHAAGKPRDSQSRRRGQLREFKANDAPETNPENPRLPPGLALVFAPRSRLPGG